MQLPLLYKALVDISPNARLASDDLNMNMRCPFCNGSDTDRYSFSIKINPEPGEPIFFQCYRASCGKKGALRADMLEEIGIMDQAVYNEVAAHNRTISPNFDRALKLGVKKDVQIINLPRGNAGAKLKYINQRLGTRLHVEDLADFKIQLSLLDMLRLNDIKKLAVGTNRAQAIDICCIGFMSMFGDYLICRDVTPDMKTGKRYYTYHIAGKADPDAIKIYSIPREIDIMDPRSAIINVAEGPFSILGAYLNTPIGWEKPNSLWLANCGAQYENTILRVCKQFGLLKVWINIWSDSEIPVDNYHKLYRTLRKRLDIRRMTAFYNDASDDFGHTAREISIHAATIYRKDG